MEVRHSRPEDDVDAFLAARNAGRVARLGELVDALAHPHLVALQDGLAGVLTYVPAEDACEVLTLHAARPRNGAGTALLDAVRAVAGDRRLWLITTNDNVDALRFYQRRGFRLAKLHPGAVEDARARLKPEIPEIGDHGIPLRDEIELWFGGTSGSTAG
jgi:ribosomal protein S18 acetylase RimI-like enzyme